MFRYFFVTALALFSLFGTQLPAQTLMTLNTGFEFTINKARSQAFEITWFFDERASRSLLIAYDTNADGQFKGREKVDLIEMLKQFEAQNYLLHLKQNETPIEPESMMVVSVNVNNALVSVTFGVSLQEPVDLQETGLNLAFVSSKRVAIDQTALVYRLKGMLAQNCRVKTLENQPLDSHNWHLVACNR